MDGLIGSSTKEMLVEMVKVTQKRKMKGSKGDWKEFLESYDKRIGSRVSDPLRRSVDDLAAFIKTFQQVDDVKLFKRVLKCHYNRQVVEKLKAISPDEESPEQGLVRLTWAHPLHPIEFSFPSYNKGWVVVKSSKKTKAMKSTKLISIDCEMVLCEDGTDALVKVCAVDRDLKVRLEEFVNPNKAIADYGTYITGITAKDLDGVTTSLEDVQIRLKKLLSHGAILVGHSVDNDLKVLKIDHARVIDTSYVFKIANAPHRKPPLSLLCKSLLDYDLRQEGNPHDCVDDACGAMKLVLARLEGKIDTVITDEVNVLVSASLFVHMIPANISSEDLKSILSGECSIEVKAAKKPGGTYSAFAVFKNIEEALDSYEKLKGDLEKDTYGRLQKLVKFNLDNGKCGSLCVCVPVSAGHVPQKRSHKDNGTSGMCKKLLTNRIGGLCEADSNQEIQRLKEELSRRDEEISNSNKLIITLAKAVEARSVFV